MIPMMAMGLEELLEKLRRTAHSGPLIFCDIIIRSMKKTPHILFISLQEIKV